GNLYSTSENGFTKVRLGVWGKYAEAEGAKMEAIHRGFPDATIITERADDPNIRDFLLSGYTPVVAETKTEKLRTVSDAPAPIVYSTMPATTHPYYVRIAALSKPESFDAYPLEGLGVVEKRKAENSPGMTIILLGSYPDVESATKIANKLINMGYEDAHVVKDEKGKLIRK
ncbi:MAG: hypothetical protein H7246_17990, partial [Phycisphaerae bacterium]|nr:hypothetical protein [Saprospiraceae bacterium]